MNCTVLYLNSATTADLHRLIEEQTPPGWTLLIPGRDGPLPSLLQLCEFIVVADHAVSAELIASSSRLQMIQHQGVGYERIDLEACRLRSIPVALCPEGTSAGVAEHTLLLILALYKKLLQTSSAVKEGRWPQWELRSTSFELFGKRLGLIGLGRIGREVASRALAFGASVSYFDPFAPGSGGDTITAAKSLVDLLQASDIVSLHVPATPANRRLINKTTLGYMQEHAVLINTARGSLVDEEALAEALRNGRLFGAGLDVLEQEPPAADNPLLSCENVLITPHISAGTRDAFRTKMKAVFANLVRYTRRETLLHVVPELADLEQKGVLAVDGN